MSISENILMEYLFDFPLLALYIVTKVRTFMIGINSSLKWEIF